MPKTKKRNKIQISSKYSIKIRETSKLGIKGCCGNKCWNEETCLGAYEWRVLVENSLEPRPKAIKKMNKPELSKG